MSPSFFSNSNSNITSNSDGSRRVSTQSILGIHNRAVRVIRNAVSSADPSATLTLPRRSGPVGSSPGQRAGAAA